MSDSRSSKGKCLNMCPIGSGNWNNSSITGVWALNLNNNRSNSNNNNAVRSDSAPNARKLEIGSKGGSFL